MSKDDWEPSSMMDTNKHKAWNTYHFDVFPSQSINHFWWTDILCGGMPKSTFVTFAPAVHISWVWESQGKALISWSADSRPSHQLHYGDPCKPYKSIHIIPESLKLQHVKNAQ